MAELLTPPAFLDLEHPTVLLALLRHIVEHADCDGVDAYGRPVLRDRKERVEPHAGGKSGAALPQRPQLGGLLHSERRIALMNEAR